MFNVKLTAKFFRGLNVSRGTNSATILLILDIVDNFFEFHCNFKPKKAGNPSAFVDKFFEFLRLICKTYSFFPICCGQPYI